MTGRRPRARTARALAGAVLALATVAAAGCSGPDGTPDLRVGPARASVPAAGVSQLVLAIENVGDGADRLVAADTDRALAVEIHETRVDAEGRAVMELRDGGVELPAGTTVRFRPGGLHLMLVVPDASVVLGGTLPVTLTFDRSPPVTVEVTVVPTVELLEDGTTGS
jgi:copper(I)-binding protein